MKIKFLMSLILLFCILIYHLNAQTTNPISEIPAGKASTETPNIPPKPVLKDLDNFAQILNELNESFNTAVAANKNEQLFADYMRKLAKLKDMARNMQDELLKSGNTDINIPKYTIAMATAFDDSRRNHAYLENSRPHKGTSSLLAGANASNSRGLSSGPREWAMAVAELHNIITKLKGNTVANKTQQLPLEKKVSSIGAKSSSANDWELKQNAREEQARQDRLAREAKQSAKEEQLRKDRLAKEEQARQDRLQKEEQMRKDQALQTAKNEQIRQENLAKEAKLKEAKDAEKRQRSYLEWAKIKMNKAENLYTECENTRWTSWSNKNIQGKLKIASAELQEISSEDIKSINPADEARLQVIKDKINEKYKHNDSEKNTIPVKRLATFPIDNQRPY